MNPKLLAVSELNLTVDQWSYQPKHFTKPWHCRKKTSGLNFYSKL